MATPRLPFRRLFLATLLLLSASDLNAQTLRYDGNDASSRVPFGEPFSGRYQQIYSGSTFTNPVFINTIRFFANDFRPTANFTAGEYELRISTARTDVLSLSPTFNNNVGLDSYLVFRGFLSETERTDYSFVLRDPFFYNPTYGDLLIDITGSTSGIANEWDAFLSGTSSRYVYSRSNTEGGIVNPGTALVTEFDTTVTPEPVSTLLVGSGLAAVLAARRRKQRRGSVGDIAA